MYFRLRRDQANKGIDGQTNRFKGWLCMMGSKECSCVCLLLYLYFIILYLDVSGARLATKESPSLSPGCGTTRQISVSKMIPLSISGIINALCNNGCVWCYVKNPSSTDSSACFDPVLRAWQHTFKC